MSKLDKVLLTLGVLVFSVIVGVAILAINKALNNSKQPCVAWKGEVCYSRPDAGEYVPGMCYSCIKRENDDS